MRGVAGLRRVTGSSQSYSDMVIADGAGSYWPMQEGTGGTAHDIISADDGTLNGAAAFQAVSLVNGHTSSVITNLTGFISLLSGGQVYAGNYSWETWVRLGNGGVQQARATFSDGAASYQNFPADEYFLSTGSGIGNFLPVVDGTIYHFVLTRAAAGNVQKLYVNGVLNDTKTDSGIIIIGAFGNSFLGGLQNSDMEMSDFATYPLVLSAAQVAAHYAKGT